MTVPSSTSSVSYTADGISALYSVPFRFLQNSHILVTTRQGTGAEVIEVGTYTVAGAGSPSGGTVTFSPVKAAGTTIVISRNVPLTQEADYVDNDPFPAESHEDALDKLTMISQQLKEQGDRSLRLPITAVGVSTQLPAPLASNLIGWNSTANGLRNFTTAEIATTVAFGNFRYDRFTATAGQTVFTLAADPGTLGNLDVSIDGVTQVPIDDYTLSGTTLTMTSALVGGERVLARYGTAAGATDASSMTWQPAGTAAVQRTVQAKLREIIHVRDYGAVGDGVNDDTAAIQAAINEAAARGGGEVRFHAGQFRISAQLSVTTSGIRLVGEGGEAYTPTVRGTEIAWFGPSGAGQTMLFFQFVDACALEGIALDCRSIAGIAVQAQGVKLSRFMNINLRNFTSIGFYGYCGNLPGQWSSTNKFENFLFTSLNNGVVGLWLDGSAVENNDWFNNVFINGFIQVARTTTESRAVLLDFCDSNTFIECDFNVFGAGNGIAVLFNSGTRNAYPENNFFYGCSINAIGINEGGGKFIGDQFFFAFTQKDGESLPTHPKLRGFTDNGQYFGEVFTLRQNLGRLRFAPRNADRSYDLVNNTNDTNDFGFQVVRRSAGTDTVVGQWDSQGVFYVFIPTLGIKAVEVGAADSAGTGFRTLRVAN